MSAIPPSPHRRHRFDLRPHAVARAAAIFAIQIAAVGAWAQNTPSPAPVVPDAGSLLQQIEQARPPQLPPRSDPTLKPDATRPATAPAGTQVEVKRFVVSGNTHLDDAALQAVLAPWVGRRLGLADLQQAAVAIGEAYTRAGRLARAFFPKQDVTDGVIQVRIVEARFGRVQLEGSPTRYDAARADAMVQAALPPGAPLDLRALDRALLLVDDLPGIAAAGSLVAGANDGETDLALKLSDTPLFSGIASVDNQGNRSTGALRESASVAVNSPLRLGDAWLTSLSHTQGSDFAALDASMPVGLQGWRVGVNASYLHYRLVAGGFAPLAASGDSHGLGATASAPLLRSRNANLVLQLAFDRKDFDNRASGRTTSRYHSGTFSAGLSGNLFDTIGGGGANAAQATLSSGTLNLNGSPTAAADALTGQTAGRFTKLRFAASRQQALTDKLSAYAGVAGQFASRNLDSSEKFYLGGPQGVRAYPVSEAGGSAGQMLNLELRGQLPAGFSLTGFYDVGHVEQAVHAGYVGAPVPNQYTLQGAGTSLTWNGPAGLRVQGTWAHRIGSNPAANAAGRDQDGSLTRNRLWLQASLFF